MSIYEVHMSLPQNKAHEFKNWLLRHIEDMKRLPYFTRATLFEAQNLNNQQTEYKVHYFLKSESSLEDYLKNAAPAMRSQLPTEFVGQVQYQRFHLKVLENSL